MDKSLRTYAKENGLTVTHNTAYGTLKGFGIFISKGKEHIRVLLSASFSNAVALADFKEDLYQKSISREYRVLELGYQPQHIVITLSYRTAADIARIDPFFNYFLPLLRKHNALRSVSDAEFTEQYTTDNGSIMNAIHSLFSKRNRSYSN